MVPFSIISGRTAGLKLQLGFTLIEVMVIVAITAILFAIAAPTFGEYTTNTRVRAAAEAFQSDITLARNEALKRNLPVTLTYDITTTLSLMTAVTPGTGAIVDIRRRDLTEEAGLVSTPTTAVVTFDSLGRATTGPLILEMSKPSKSTCEAAGGKVRCMSVRISNIGTSRMCDPNLVYASNPRGC